MTSATVLTWRRLLLASIALATVLNLNVRGDTIYRETFGRPNGATGDINPTNFLWVIFTNGVARLAAIGVSPNIGSPTNVANVNAGSNVNGSFTNSALGVCFSDTTGGWTNLLCFTPEFSFDLNSYAPGSIVFNWLEGNGSTANTCQVAVRIGGTWYVSTQTFANSAPVNGGGNFYLPSNGGGAQPMAFTFSPTAANWKVLNFNGSYATNGSIASSSIGLSLGAAPGADLTGTITAFGLYGFENGASAIMRFDTFTINATPITGKNVAWTGSINAAWDTNTFNWTSGAAATNYLDGDFVLFNDTASLSTINLPNAVSPGSVTVSNNILDYTINGSINGSGALTKLGTNTLVLSGTNFYGGGTMVSNGTVLVNGNNRGTGLFAVTAGATLGGTGAISGAVSIQAGGSLVPGAGGGSMASLTISNNLSLAPGSFTTMKILTGGTEDQVVITGTLTYDGALTVTNVGASLVAGDAFQLFAASIYTNNFATTILPPLNGNLIWLNTLSSNGTLTVVIPVAAAITNLPATSVQGTYATLNGQVLSAGSQAPVITMYYGPANGGTNPAAWSNNVSLGTQSGSFSHPAAGLATNTTYYYTVAASNVAGVVWAAPSQSFTTQATDPANVPTLVQYLSGTDKDNTVPWQFSISSGRLAGIATNIAVPSCWEMQGFGTYNYGQNGSVSNAETGFYTNIFSVPSDWAGKKIFLVFEGAFTDTSVSVNGQPVGGTHRGGYYEFKYDVTSRVVVGAATNVLTVIVRRWSIDPFIVGAEEKGDYWDFGGIYRPVYLEAKPVVNIERIAANPLANGNITLNTYLGGVADNYTVKAFVTDTNSAQLGSPFAGTVTPGATNILLSASLPSPKTWSSEFPNLYTLTVQLIDTNNTLVHTVTNLIGFRTVTFSNNQGFFINGKKVLMRGSARHEVWPTTGRTISRAVCDLDIQLMKDMNMNAVRLSHYPQNKMFYEECDRLGLYVLDEFDSYQFVIDTTNGIRLVEEMIRRDVNHPCIFAWDNGNEGGANGNLDGGNGGSTNYYALYDIQNRKVVRPAQGTPNYFQGLATDHYEYYNSITNYLRDNAPGVYMPTEILHGLYDGGGGACLAEFWEAFRTAPFNSGGMFIWAFLDEGITNTQTGQMDVKGSSAPDGLVGPYREKEASYYTCKSIFSTVQVGLTNPAAFAGILAVSNRFDFTDLNQCTFRWQLGWFADATDPANNFSTNALVGGFLIALDSGNFSGPAMPAGIAGSLALPGFPAGARTNYDAVRLTATDPLGNNIYTWTLPLRTQAQIRDRIVGLVSLGAPTISAGTNATEIAVTNGARIIRFSKASGVINSLSVSNVAVSFTNGPRPTAGAAWPVTGVTNYFDGTNYIILINDLTNAANGFQWTLRPDGWLKLSYRYTLAGLQENIGITFDYPSSQATAMNWLGQGPYRVWKNRLAGQEIFTHTKRTNNTWTGSAASASPWVYPEFAGFHAQLFWATLQTTEQPITIATPATNLFFRVFTPPATDQANTYRDARFAPGGISLQQGISAIGEKFALASNMGPSAQTNIATGLYTGEADFFFGALPASSADRDNNGLKDSWEIKYFGAPGQDAFSRINPDGLPLMLENAFDFSPTNNNLNSPRLPHFAKGTSSPVALIYTVPASQADFFNYTPQLSEDLKTWVGIDQQPGYFIVTTSPSGLDTVFKVEPNAANWPGDSSHLFLRLKIKPKP